MKLIQLFVSSFGFLDIRDFANSMLKPKLLIVTLPIAALSGAAELYFGLKLVTVVAFCLLLSMEVITGLWASKIKGIPIESNRAKRAGFVVGFWMILFFILHSLKSHYPPESIYYDLFSWLHSTELIFVSCVYLISVWENLGVMSGKSNQPMIHALRRKINAFLNIDEGDINNPKSNL